MTTEVCMADSDSDSLPELSDLFPALSNDISIGEIVWAKFKKLYWPALVRHVYKKEKKVTVWYTDDPGKIFKLHMKDVVLFHDREMTAKIKKAAREAGVTGAHEGLTTHAMSYLNRKARGIKDDPLKFFDQTFPFFTVEDWLEKHPNADKESFMSLKIEPLYINHNISTTDIRKRGSTSGQCAGEDEDSDVKSTEGEEESDEESSSLTKIYIGKMMIDSSDNEYANKIVACITSGKVDTHLVNVRSGKVSSEHQEFYLRAMETDKRDLDYISYGPVEDIKHLREIVFYLLHLYGRVSCKKDENLIGSDVARFCINKTEESRYVTSVWLPESIIFAISSINSVSVSEANRMFRKLSVSKPEKVQNLLKTINKDDVDIAKKIHSTDSNKVMESEAGISLSSKHEDHYDKDMEGTSTKRCHFDMDYEKCKDSASSKASKKSLKKPCRRITRKSEKSN